MPVCCTASNSVCCLFQWKIRRSLAFSIHEVARIIGPEATCTELLGVFDDFLKDIDEVSSVCLCVCVCVHACVRVCVCVSA